VDLVKILDGAIHRLPGGDHTLGLRAVKRHIAAAIRHFDREDNGDLDSFTDAIYRTNQAFEGGLKEAYRVLTGKDPAKLTPYQIENYLEENRIIRPRALKQLTRYREDYRNPSVHDYKLDFDADEALLAIVSVCAFTKLLLNQISARLAFDAGSSLPVSDMKETFTNIHEFVYYVAAILQEALPSFSESDDLDSSELNGFVDGALTKNKLLTEPILDNQGEDEAHPWDNVVSQSGFSLPIEGRVLRTSSLRKSLSYINTHIAESEFDCVLFVLFNEHSPGPFLLYSGGLADGKHLYVLTQDLELGASGDEVLLSKLKLIDSLS
jgi:hypothetical protein